MKTYYVTLHWALASTPVAICHSMRRAKRAARAAWDQSRDPWYVLITPSTCDAIIATGRNGRGMKWLAEAKKNLTSQPMSPMMPCR